MRCYKNSIILYDHNILEGIAGFFYGAHTKIMSISFLQYSPEHLPRLPMFVLLTQLICTAAGRLQQDCATVLQELAVCASGMEGCAAAAQSEVDVLLHATYSPSSLIREIALQVAYLVPSISLYIIIL